MKQASNNTPARVRRTFRHTLTRETTALRFTRDRGMISRPERAGQDVGAHVFCAGESLERCREVWRAAQAALIAEGFEITGTEIR